MDLQHSDDERYLGVNIGVLTISNGEKRKFRIRNKSTIVLADCHMFGSFQKKYTHEIPKRNDGRK